MSEDPASSSSTAVPSYDFPPFPPVPPGATIIPFSEFKERGIAIFSDEFGEEVDGLGIPTVELRAKHPDTDECKSDAAKYRERKAQAKLVKKALAGNEKGSGVPGVNWWEHWEEGEKARWVAGRSTLESPMDRFYQVSKDFKSYRIWPPANYGLGNQWDQFRLFSGLLASTPIWTLPEDKKETADDDEADDDDADSDFADKDDNSKSDPRTSHEPRVYSKRGRARAPYQDYGKGPIAALGPEHVAELLHEEDLKRDAKAEEFLEDPGRAIAEFLSSYMRKQGLVWASRNLVQVPRLIHFFVRYMYNTNVLDDSAGQASLQLAIDIAEKALEELPLTSSLSQALPDEFSRACTSLFGSKEEPVRFDLDDGSHLGWDDQVEADTSSATADDWADSLGGKDEDAVPDIVFPEVPATMQEADTSPNAYQGETVILDVTGAEDDPRQECHLSEPYQIDDEEDPTGSGSVASWNDPIESAELERQLLASEAERWGAETGDWVDVYVPSLLHLLGPTVLPLTHKTGIVEFSVRRIKSIALPDLDAKSAVGPSSGGSNADAVELELSKRFARVTLVPWLDWDITDEREYARPIIRSTSSGDVVLQDCPPTSSSGVPAAPATAPTSSAGKTAHNPLVDEITLVIAKDVVKHMRVGMGIWGTWVQLVREQEHNEEESLHEPKRPVTTSEPSSGKGKGKKGSSVKKDVRFWYVERVTAVFPSYYVPTATT